MSELITHQLKQNIQKYNTKLVIISDIVGFFLDKDIPEVETQRIFNHVATYLSNFGRENHIIIIVTYPSHVESSRNYLLHRQTCSRANVILSLNRYSHAKRIVLEKHPYLSAGFVELLDESLSIADFVEGNA